MPNLGKTLGILSPVKCHYANSHGLGPPANSLTMNSRMVCPDPKNYFLSRAILDLKTLHLPLTTNRLTDRHADTDTGTLQIIDSIGQGAG